MAEVENVGRAGVFGSLCEAFESPLKALSNLSKSQYTSSIQCPFLHLFVMYWFHSPIFLLPLPLDD